MYLRLACERCARLALIFVLAALAIFIPVTPLHAASEPPVHPPVRGVELQGFLAAAGDMHFLGLEPDSGVDTVVVTLAYRVDEGALIQDGANFTVLAEEALQAYLAGTSLNETSAVDGRILYSQDSGTIAQATLTVDGSSGYTVIVWNQWQSPAHYILSVHGGTLIDEGGQTLLREPSGPEMLAPQKQPSNDKMLPYGDREPAQFPLDIQPQLVEKDVKGHGQASTISGNLQPLTDRHYYDLWPASKGGEITVRMSYSAGSQAPAQGTVNFWILTQDSLLRVNQGALPLELNLATGRPAGNGNPNETMAELRLGGEDAYTLIVFNESAVAAEYDIEVEGAQLVDPYGFALTGKDDGVNVSKPVGLEASAMTAFRQP